MIENELRGRRIEMAKTGGGLATILGGAVAMAFGEGPVKVAGGVIFLGTLVVPLIYVIKDAVRDWRGDDLRNSGGN